MLAIPSTIDVPLRRTEDGAIRIGQTRVLLEIIIRAFQNGDSPEIIAENFSALKLDDIYAVIAYYLQHQDEVHKYMNQVQQDADEIRQKIESKQNLKGLRERLLKRKGK